jgi:hypothetical protein
VFVVGFSILYLKKVLRIADALGLKIITSNIEIEYTRYKHYKEDHIRLHLKQQKTLRNSENPLVLPFRISYVDYHTPIKRSFHKIMPKF